MSEPSALVGPAFGPRGRRIWADLCERAAGEVGIALLEEVCRTADRLDRLDAVLSGEVDTWLHLVDAVGAGTEVRVTVDQVLSEARQQGAALARLVAALPLKASDGDDGDSWLDGLSTSVCDPSGS